MLRLFCSMEFGIAPGSSRQRAHRVLPAAAAKAKAVAKSLVDSACSADTTQPDISAFDLAAEPLPLLGMFNMRDTFAMFDSEVEPMLSPARAAALWHQIRCRLGDVRAWDADMGTTPRRCGCCYHKACLASTDECPRCAPVLIAHFDAALKKFDQDIMDTAAEAEQAGPATEAGRKVTVHRHA